MTLLLICYSGEDMSENEKLISEIRKELVELISKKSQEPTISSK